MIDIGIPGPKPLPENLRLLKGRDHHAKRSYQQFSTIDNVTRFSQALRDSLPREVLERAEKTFAVLVEKRVLSECDLESFERYCHHLRLVYEADKLLQEEGILSIDEKGNAHKHPATQIHRDNSLAALRYEEQFGLTPSARMRLSKTDEQKQEDDYAQYRKRGAASSA